MPSLNKCEIIGNLGSTPELRFTPNGRPVTNFSVAVNRKYTMASGETGEDTEWFSIVTWGKLAENCSAHLAKGALVYVSGRISLHKWEKQDGAESSKLELSANTVQFLTKKDSQQVPSDELEPEDIPF